jgi:hypothetical membrane protein
LDESIVLTPRDRFLVAGAIWGPGLFIVAWVVGGVLFPGYSPLEDTISELAAVDAPTGVLMSLGLAAYSVGVGTSAWPLRRVIGRLAAVALALNATLTLGVLLTPLDRSVGTDLLHSVFAFLAYVSLVVTGPLSSPVLRRQGRIRWRRVSLIVGFATMLWLGASLGGTMPGLFQRLGLTTTHIWLMAIGRAVLGGHFNSDEAVSGQQTASSQP